MKKFVIARILFLGLISSWANQSAGSSSLALFQIQSKAFPIPVGYVANVNSNCTFNSGNPISVGWVGDTAKLSWKLRLGMGSVMGVNINSKDSQQVIFQVKAMVKNNVPWPLTVQIAVQEGQCVAKTLTPGEGEEILAINIIALKGYLPTQIVVDGLLNGESVQTPISFDPTEMASNQ